MAYGLTIGFTIKAVFVAETKKQDGSRYHPKSVYMLLTGLFHHTHSQPTLAPTSMTQEISVFRLYITPLTPFFESCGCKELAMRLRKHSHSHKWKKSCSGSLICSQLRMRRDCCVQYFFPNGKTFVYWGGGGGEEHWQLKLSQLKKFTDPLRYAYIENTSKNHSGILAQMRVKNKAVLIVAVPEVGTRCHVHVLDLYIQKLFQAAFTHDNFYVQPCSTVPDDSSKPWFTVNPIGKNSLSKMVKEVCSEGGISGRKITHSLHASDRCNKPGVPENLIQEKTGHLSVSGLRHYERTTIGQPEMVSRILSATDGTTYQKQLSLQTASRVPVLPPVPPPVQLPVLVTQMNFSGCNVTIYSGHSPSLLQPQSSVPPSLPTLPLGNILDV